jgi:hypothetical protein
LRISHKKMSEERPKTDGSAFSDRLLGRPGRRAVKLVVACVLAVELAGCVGPGLEPPGKGSASGGGAGTGIPTTFVDGGAKLGAAGTGSYGTAGSGAGTSGATADAGAAALDAGLLPESDGGSDDGGATR